MYRTQFYKVIYLKLLVFLEKTTKNNVFVYLKDNNKKLFSFKHTKRLPPFQYKKCTNTNEFTKRKKGFFFWFFTFVKTI